MHNGSPDVINQLFLDELLAIVNGIEDFTDGQRCSRVLPDEAEAFLQLRRNWIFEPEQLKRFEALPQAPCFNWCEPVMRVVQQVKIRSELLAQPFKYARHEVQVEILIADIFRRKI